MRDRITRLVAGVGVDPRDVGCRISTFAGALEVDLVIPAAIDRRLQHAVAVRVLDAVRASRRTYGQVDVNVRGTG